MLITLDVELHSLRCFEVSNAYFRPNEGFESFPSLVNLALHGGHLTALVEASFLTSAVLPSLRLFRASLVGFDGISRHSTLTPPSTICTASLHHLSVEDMDVDIVRLLLPTQQLRSLDVSYFAEPDSPPIFASPHR